MANIEQYRFEVEAQTGQALSKLKEVRKMMDEIERIQSRGESDYSTTNQKDMDKNMRNMAKVTTEYGRMIKELRAIQREIEDSASQMHVPSSASGKQREEMEREVGAMQQTMQTYVKQVQSEQSALQGAYNKTLKSFRELAGYQQNYSRNFRPVFSSNDINNLPGPGLERHGELKRSKGGQHSVGINYEDDTDAVERARERARRIVDSMIDGGDGTTHTIKDINTMRRDAERLERRSESLSRRAQASDYMSYQQAQNFRKDYHTTQTNYVDLDEENRQRLVDLGMERSRLHSELKDIESNPMSGSDQSLIDRKVYIQETIRSMDQERDAREELSRTLTRTIQNLEKFNERVQNVEVKPERGTLKGMAYERAPAIGLALGGAFGLTFGSLYNRGVSAERGMRDDVISIGQRTGKDDWRKDVRDNAMSIGMEDRLGFTGSETLAFTDAYLSQRGYKDQEDLDTATKSQAEFSRVTGTDAATTAQFFESMFDSARMDGSSVKDIQNAFVGGIKASGMEGREEDQLKALEGLVSSVSEGRVIGQEDVMSLMGLQTILNNSGEALRGSRGMEVMTGLNESIRGGIDDPNMRLLFGMGSKFQGPEGYLQLMEQMERGVTDPDNIKRFFDVAQQTAGEGASDEAVMGLAAGLMRQAGADINSEEVRDLHGLVKSGELTQENIDEILSQTSQIGEDESESKLENYQNQDEARANQSDATTEEQSVQLSDMTDALKAVNNSLSWLPAPIYGLTAAIGALIVTLASSGGSFTLARQVRKAASDTYQNGKGPKDKGGGGPLGRVGQWFGDTKDAATKGAGNLFGGMFDQNVKKGGLPNTGPKTTSTGKGSGLGSLVGNISQTISKAIDKFRGGGKGGGGGNAGIIAPGGGLGGGLGGNLGNLASKVMLPLNLLTGASAVMEAPEGTKAQTAGEITGGIFGGMGGGAAAGAAIGSIVPGVGTAIGGVAGSILGSIGGSKLGGWIGEKAGDLGGKIKGLFSRDGEGASDIQTQEGANDIQAQVDRENATRKEHTERTRSDNISEERANLDRQETLLTRMTNLLHEAKSMNGMFGGMLGGGESDAASVLSGNSNAEQIWNFFAEKGFSPASISGILGNLEVESGLDPTATNPSSGAYGIGQWLGARKTNLHNYAKQTGGSASSLQTQLDFLWKELQEGKDSRVNLESFKKLSDPKKAATIFERDFERSGGALMNKRKSSAQQYYNNMKIDSNINVTVSPSESVANKVRSSKDLEAIAQSINQKIYGSMNYYAKDMRRV